MIRNLVDILLGIMDVDQHRSFILRHEWMTGNMGFRKEAGEEDALACRSAHIPGNIDDRHEL